MMQVDTVVQAMQGRSNVPSGVRRRRHGLGSGLLALVMMLGPAGGSAEVRLETSVAKVNDPMGASSSVEPRADPTVRVLPGDELRYGITFTNHSDTPVDRGRIVITNPIPPGTQYVAGSAGGRATRVEYSVDGTTFAESEPVPADGAAPDAGPEPAVVSLRWSYDAVLAPGRSGEVFFHVRMR
jgi:uncharacterized repeat protein (TIGR01451 family)